MNLSFFRNKCVPELYTMYVRSSSYQAQLCNASLKITTGSNGAYESCMLLSLSKNRENWTIIASVLTFFFT